MQAGREGLAIARGSRSRVVKNRSYLNVVALWNNFFTIVFYDLKTFLVQNSAILRKAARKRNYELPSVSNDMQSSETLRNSLGLNYKSND